MKHNSIHNLNRTSSRRGSKVFHIIGWTVMGLLFAALFALVFGFVVKWLWNWLMPALFGLGAITYWQAFGIVLLAKLLFGGFGGHHRSDHDHFSSRFHDRWHGFFGAEREDWSPELERKYNRHYRQFWREEGKKAFEDYLQRAESQETEMKEE
jgi:hypothetical protein